MRILICSFLLSLLCSCVKMIEPDETLVPDKPGTNTHSAVSLSFSAREVNFYSTNSKRSVVISSDSIWNVENVPQWCSLSASRGADGDTLTISVSDNQGSSLRSGFLKIRRGLVEDSLCVYQTPGRISSGFSFSLTPGCLVSSVSFAPLKYDKKMAYSYVAADGRNRPYCKLFKYMNGKYINSGNYWHPNMPVTTDGFYPSRALTYSDGCGNLRRFPLANSIVPLRDMSSSQFPYDRTDADKYFSLLTWPEIYEIIDFEGSIQFHNVREVGVYQSTGIFWDKNNPQEILLGLKEVQDYIESRLGRGMTVMAIPDNDNYEPAGDAFEDILMMTDASFPADINVLDMDLAKLKRSIYLQEDFDLHSVDFDRYYNKCGDDYKGWVVHVTHDVEADFSSQDPRARMLDYVYDNHGSQSADDVWVATPDEVYQYCYSVKNSQIQTYTQPSVFSITLDLALAKNFYWSEFTLLIRGENLPQEPVFEYSDEVVGFSWTRRSQNEILVNINFDQTLLSRAEKYTAIYEVNPNDETLNDALYFVDRLTELKARELRKRLAR